jgi:hypothetical protein
MRAYELQQQSDSKRVSKRKNSVRASDGRETAQLAGCREETPSRQLVNRGNCRLF